MYVSSFSGCIGGVCAAFVLAVICYAGPIGTYQGCESCCGGFDDSSDRCPSYYCPPPGGCCTEANPATHTCFGCGPYSFCDEWNPPSTYPDGSPKLTCKTVGYYPPPPPFFVDTVYASTNYWSACSGNSTTLRGNAVGAVWDGNYGTVSTYDDAALTVAKSATVTSVVLSGVGPSIIRGLVTSLILNASSTVTVWGTAKNISITGPNATASLAFGAIVNNVAASTFKPTLLISNTLSLIESNGATTVSRTGVISNLTHFGGTVQMMWGSNVASMQFGEERGGNDCWCCPIYHHHRYQRDGNASIAGEASSINVISTNVTVSLLPTAIVDTLQTYNNMANVLIGNTIVALRSNGATVVHPTGVINSLTHDGGNVTIDLGGVVQSLTGYGNFTVGGKVASVNCTASCNISLLSQGSVTNVTTTSPVPMILGVRFVDSVEKNITVTIRSQVAISSSRGDSGTTTIMVVESGGTLTLHGLFGGAVVLYNSGGVVEKLYGYGRFDIASGTAAVVSTTRPAASPSTVLVRRGASVDNLLIAGAETDVVIEGVVGSITLLPSARIVHIIVRGAGSQLGGLNASTAASLETLYVNATNGASVGCLAIMGGPQLAVTLHYSGASVVANSTSCPVMLLIHNQPMSVTITTESCNITTLNLTSSVNRLVARNSTHISMRNTNVTITNNVEADSDDVPFMEFGMSRTMRAGMGVFSFVVTGGIWRGPTSRWIRLSGYSSDTSTLATTLLSVSMTNVQLMSTSFTGTTGPTVVVFDYVCSVDECLIPNGSTIHLDGIALGREHTEAEEASHALTGKITFVSLRTAQYGLTKSSLQGAGVSIWVSTCSAPNGFVGRISVVDVGGVVDNGTTSGGQEQELSTTSVTLLSNSSILVESIPIQWSTENISMIPELIAVSLTPNTIVKATNITVRCVDVPSLTSDGLIILGGSVAVDCVVLVALVAIRQSSAANASLVRFTSDRSREERNSRGNVVSILHSNVRVPEIVSSLHGSDVFDSGGGIQVECSFVGTTPMSVGHFHSLSKNILLLRCSQSKLGSMPQLGNPHAARSMSMVDGGSGYIGFHCWKSYSMSHSATEEGTTEGTRSSTVGSFTPSHTVSSSVTRSVSKSETVSRSAPSRSRPSPTTTSSLSETRTLTPSPSPTVVSPELTRTLSCLGTYNRGLGEILTPVTDGLSRRCDAARLQLPIHLGLTTTNSGDDDGNTLPNWRYYCETIHAVDNDGIIRSTSIDAATIDAAVMVNGSNDPSRFRRLVKLSAFFGSEAPWVAIVPYAIDGSWVLRVASSTQMWPHITQDTERHPLISPPSWLIRRVKEAEEKIPEEYAYDPMSYVWVNRSVLSSTTTGSVVMFIASRPPFGSVTRLPMRAWCGGKSVPVEFAIQWPIKELSTVAQTLGGIIAILGLLTGDPSAAAAIAMVSMLSCSGSTPSLSRLSYVVSVFFDLGSIALSVGNLGLTAAIFVFHASFAWLLLAWRQRQRKQRVLLKRTSKGTSAENKMPAETSPLDELHQEHHDSADTKTRLENEIADEHIVVPYESDEEDIRRQALGDARFPALTIKAATFLLPGCAYGAAVAMSSSESNGGEVTIGVFILLAVMLSVLVMQLVLYRIVLPQMTFAPYVLPYRTGFWIECKFTLPTGRWMPAVLRQSYQPLLGNRMGVFSKLSVVDFILVILLSITTGVGVGTNGGSCSFLPVLIAILYILHACALIVFRPHRLPVDRAIYPTIAALFGTLCLVKFYSPNADDAIDGLQMTLTVLQLVQMLCTLTVMWREYQWRQIEGYADAVGAPLQPRPSLLSFSSGTASRDDTMNLSAMGNLDNNELDDHSGSAVEIELGANRSIHSTTNSRMSHSITSTGDLFLNRSGTMDDSKFWDQYGNAIPMNASFQNIVTMAELVGDKDTTDRLEVTAVEMR
ncbi:outer membrane autotransporter barrel domain protein, putative [Bodo saltans]|uniref:Outer membrane autotransporter barrel domain protein, putative n=1 Tax=Bodo saltans TaxID=75058 RepID=A0A0S4J3R6_BODSA|nr:outer membrane autotransporter barrel domain protein, putative [Bodo saltans]|eukprot:CUG09602.1 outer membrane autotransporter barrel domain protein, putative [Bodo saltans]